MHRPQYTRLSLGLLFIGTMAFQRLTETGWSVENETTTEIRALGGFGPEGGIWVYEDRDTEVTEHEVDSAYGSETEPIETEPVGSWHQPSCEGNGETQEILPLSNQLAISAGPKYWAADDGDTRDLQEFKYVVGFSIHFEPSLY